MDLCAEQSDAGVQLDSSVKEVVAKRGKASRRIAEKW
jgi:hypothetical protein